jgi:hypothetical protein
MKKNKAAKLISTRVVRENPVLFLYFAVQRGRKVISLFMFFSALSPLHSSLTPLTGSSSPPHSAELQRQSGMTGLIPSLTLVATGSYIHAYEGSRP